MMAEIKNPFEFFIDKNGEPLNNGKIYIGESELNPEAYPVNVYFDEDLTIPAAQPLKTINGLIHINGTPAKIYVSSDNYTITVRNKNDEFIYTSSIKRKDVIPKVDNIVQSVIPKNYVWNPFILWQRGTEFDEDTFDLRYGVADGWSFARENFTLNGIIKSTEGENFPYALTMQRASGSSSNAEFNLNMNLSFEETLLLRGKKVTFGFAAKTGENFSALNGLIELSLRFTKHIIPQSLNSDDGKYSVDDNLIDTVSMNATSIVKSVNKTTEIPATANQVQLHFRWKPSGIAGAEDFIKIQNPFLLIGNSAVPLNFDFTSIENILLRANREYVKSYSYDVAPRTVTNQGSIEIITEGLENNLNLAERINLPIDMVGLPSISILNTALNAVGLIDRTGKIANLTDETYLPVYVDNISSKSFVVKNFVDLSTKKRGTYTPSLDNVTATYTKQIGNYKIEGDWCFGDIEINCSSFNNSDASAATIITLPVEAAAAVGGLGFFQISPILSTLINWTSGDSLTPALIGSQTIGLYDKNSAIVTYNGGRFNASGNLLISYAYRIVADSSNINDGYKTRKYGFHYIAEARL